MGIAFQQATAIQQMPELRETPETFEYSAEICFHHPRGRAGLLFGINGGGNGYALIVSAEKQCVHFMECKSRAVLIDRGMRRLPIKQETWYPLRARYDGSILRLWLNENPLDGEPWPKFEFALELPGRGAGLYLENGTAEVRGERLVRWTDEKPKVPTFTNPVLTGADPDILLHADGAVELLNQTVQWGIHLTAVDMPQRHGQRVCVLFLSAPCHHGQQRQRQQTQNDPLFHISPTPSKRIPWLRMSYPI